MTRCKTAKAVENPFIDGVFPRVWLQHGADPGRKNRDGHTALDLVKEGDTDVEDLLRGEGGGATKGRTFFETLLGLAAIAEV